MSFQAYIPTSSSEYLGKIANRVRNVTGQVVKTETYSFAFGGNSDIWKGLLSEKDSGNTTEVQTYLLACWHFLKLHSTGGGQGYQRTPGACHARGAIESSHYNTVPDAFLSSIRDSSEKCVFGPPSTTQISRHSWASPLISTDRKCPALSLRIFVMAIFRSTSRIIRTLTGLRW